MSSSTTPSSVGMQLRRLLAFLDLAEGDCRLLPLTGVTGFIPEASNCHLNVIIQSQLAGGRAAFGWLLWEDRASGICQAMFHSVWIDDAGLCFDITPRVDAERLVMFVPDATRRIALFGGAERAVIFGYDNLCARPGRVLTGLTHTRYAVPADISRRYGLAQLPH
jgi:hypothetical protein